MSDTPTRPALTAEQRADLRTDYEWDVREGAPWERRTAQAILALLDERDRLEAAVRRLVGMHEAEHAALHDDDDGNPVPIDRCPVRFCQAAAAVRALVHERTEAHETPTRPALTAEHRAALRQKAEAATPGEWVAVEAPQGWWTVESSSEDWRVADSLDQVDAAYVAAAHPQAILALLDERDRLEARLPGPDEPLCAPREEE